MPESLNIGILGTRGIPNQYGGFEAFAQQLAPWLAQKGHQVTVYCSHRHPLDDTDWKGVQRVKCYDPENRLGSAGQFVYDYNCNYHANKQQFDVLLHLGYTSDAIWYEMWSKRAAHIVNMDGIEWQRAKYSWPVRKFLKWSEKLAGINAAYLVADATPIEVYLKKAYNTKVKYIAYPALLPVIWDDGALQRYKVRENHFDLLIARSEPENNIEMAIRAKLIANDNIPLHIFGNQNIYRQRLERRYGSVSLIRFEKAEYNEAVLNTLRKNCRYYIHGHSAGGTNPSLLEAMACGCTILAHKNIYNQSVTGQHAHYFSSEPELSNKFLNESLEKSRAAMAEVNIKKIRHNYHPDVICSAYENLFYEVVQNRPS